MIKTGQPSYWIPNAKLVANDVLTIFHCVKDHIQLLKKLSQCLVILESLTWHKSNKLANILKIIYTIV